MVLTLGSTLKYGEKPLKKFSSNAVDLAILQIEMLGILGEEKYGSSVKLAQKASVLVKRDVSFVGDCEDA